jgi:hypothetical protein
MLPDDIYTCILNDIDECHLMTLRTVCKEWKKYCENMIRNRNESDIRHMLLACRYKCNRVPLKWLIRRNTIHRNPEYRCAYCNGIVYQIGECKNKHRSPYKIAQQILAGPMITSIIFSLLYGMLPILKVRKVIVQ